MNKQILSIIVTGLLMLPTIGVFAMKRKLVELVEVVDEEKSNKKQKFDELRTRFNDIQDKLLLVTGDDKNLKTFCEAISALIDQEPSGFGWSLHNEAWYKKLIEAYHNSTKTPEAVAEILFEHAHALKTKSSLFIKLAGKIKQKENPEVISNFDTRKILERYRIDCGQRAIHLREQGNEVEEIAQEFEEIAKNSSKITKDDFIEEEEDIEIKTKCTFQFTDPETKETYHIECTDDLIKSLKSEYLNIMFFGDFKESITRFCKVHFLCKQETAKLFFEILKKIKKLNNGEALHEIDFSVDENFELAMIEKVLVKQTIQTLLATIKFANYPAIFGLVSALNIDFLHHDLVAHFAELAEQKDVDALLSNNKNLEIDPGLCDMIVRKINKQKLISYINNLTSMPSKLDLDSKKTGFTIYDIKDVVDALEQKFGKNNLANLKHLYLNNNQITKIENLDNFTNLQWLDLNNNQITKIENLDNFTNLQWLNLGNNQITKIENLDNFTNLEWLYLNNNQITKIENLDNLKNLITLCLEKNQITKIENLDSITSLLELYLENNQITTIDGLNNLANLKRLCLEKNQITKVENLDKLTNLKSLELNNNQITKIENLDNLTNLQWLDLDSNQITTIEGLDNLTNLKLLYLNNNQITTIENLDNLTNLTKLWLENNQITKIESLDNLTNLEDLDLDSNQITTIEGLDNLTNLKLLYLNNNQITKIKNLDNLTNLQLLELSNNNQITKIENLDKLTALILLHLNQNLLASLKQETPKILKQLTRLRLYHQTMSTHEVKIDGFTFIEFLSVDYTEITSEKLENNKPFIATYKKQ